MEDTKMSKLDHYLPRYYKGYDIDKILCKIDLLEDLTHNEDLILREIRNICMEKVFEKRKKVDGPENPTVLTHYEPFPRFNQYN